jgi:hypothetical protein
MRSSMYGKLNIKSLDHRIRDIWYTRNDELKPLPEFGYSMAEPDLEGVEDRDLILKLLSIKDGMYLVNREGGVLSVREESVIFMYYYMDLTFTEIGWCFKRTCTRIQQIHDKAIRKLRREAYTMVDDKASVNMALPKGRQIPWQTLHHGATD